MRLSKNLSKVKVGEESEENGFCEECEFVTTRPKIQLNGLKLFL